MIETKLFEMQDLQYKAFHSKLMPTVNPDRIIGVRVPLLRKFAKEFSKTDEAEIFMKNLPHSYYEENNLHAFLIEQINDYEKTLEELNIFLPYIDNWATCDSLTPKVFAKHTDELIAEIEQLLPEDLPHVFISSVTGQGIMALKDMLWRAITDESNRIEPSVITHRPLDGHHRVREEDEFIFENVPGVAECDEDEEWDDNWDDEIEYDWDEDTEPFEYDK